MKQKNNIRMYSIILLSLALILSPLCPKVYGELMQDNEDVTLTVDYKNTGDMPKHFRKSNDNINIEGQKLPNLTGLDTLNASGSSQFSDKGLKLVKQSIGDKKPIVIVDLRQESHGFINGIPVSWLGKGNKANWGLSKEQVLADEKKKLSSIKLGTPLELSGDKEIIVPEKVESEEQLVRREGMYYVRIPVTDNERPTDEMVDYFVQFVRTAAPNTWMHFHCKHGVGRTTTFMTMYDMMKNAKQVSLEDIMNRQVMLGGKNLIKENDMENKIESNGQKRSEFLKKFYKYCVDNKDNYRTNWSQWLKSQTATSINE